MKQKTALNFSPLCLTEMLVKNLATDY